MLQSIHVKNLALIDESEVEFSEGLNIITGETGAGKSLLIGSVNLALGGKFDSSMLRNGADQGSVELVFSTTDANVIEKMKEMDLSIEDDGVIIFTRKLSAGKSTCKINGESVTVKQVQELAEELIDIHGQHEHTSLSKKGKHLEILDSFDENLIGNQLITVKEAYDNWKIAVKELEENVRDEAGIDREKSLLEFECNEIEGAALTEGEDDELENRFRIMSNSRKILESLSETFSYTGSDSDCGAVSQIGRALQSISAVSGYDDKLKALESQLIDAEAILNDLNRDLSSYLSDYEFSDEEFAAVGERLDVINSLKRKYGKTIEDIVLYGEKSKEKLEKFLDYDNYLSKLRENEKKTSEAYLKAAQNLSATRKKVATEFAKTLKDTLVNLNFLSVEFEVAFSECDKYTAKGIDEVEFMISTNPGEALKPLGSVASGGELSRIMLGIKTVMARKDSIASLIFDEIDAGISGRTAWKVSEQLGLLGRDHQVLCITHLPQIAAMADEHVVIEKMTDSNGTVTHVRSITGEESISELARLLGSDEETAAALENARDIRNKALDFKKQSV